MNNELLKHEVHNYWNKASCGTKITRQEKFSKEYFEEIEEYRYSVEPEIFSFAQFSRYHGKKILEVGVGAGTDFLQWTRVSSDTYGIDLTPEAIDNTRKRLQRYRLSAKELQVADAENIPYEDNFFDLVYSWGVIHHSPDTIKCLEEIIRVTKPGGTIKIMVYNRHSLFALYRYIIIALRKKNPFLTFSKVLFNNQESKGTKAYTKKEIRRIVAAYPVTIVHIDATVTPHDLLSYGSKLRQSLAYILACIWGWNRRGWFMAITLKKN